MEDESALALEEAIQRLPDPNESDEDSPDTMTDVIDDKDRDEENVMNGSGSCSLPRRYPPGQRQVFGGASSSGGRGGGVDKSPLTLRRVLENGPHFAHFQQFLKDQCITRNLNFWLACEGYRNSPSRRTESANAIYAKFLKGNAPMHVSVLTPTRRKIQWALQQGRADQDLFDGAQEEVLQMMEQNELRQFLFSDSMADCISQTDSEIQYMGGLQPRFLPATYGGGSLQSGSDDSASITSYTSAESDQVARTTLLCVPPHTRQRHHHHHHHQYNRPHSDTEYSSKSYHSNAASMIHYSNSKKLLRPAQLFDALYPKLLAVQNERNRLKKKASNIAREAGKTYEEIMSQEWYDAPDACKYKFSEDSLSTYGSPSHQDKQEPSSHIVSQAAQEVQQAMRDLDITRKASMKINSSLQSSSASSYISDSGVGESWGQPRAASSQMLANDIIYGANGRVEEYIQRQHEIQNQSSPRETKARVAATMIMNSGIYADEVNPIRQGRPQMLHIHRHAYSGDDSSSAFTGASHSSSEFFIPRRTPHLYTDSGSPQQPPRMRRMNHPRRSSRFPPQMQTSRALSPSVPVQQQQQQLQQQQPAASTSSSMDSLLVVYTMEGQSAPAPFAKRVPNTVLTLSEFREKVFARNGNYRFFFKSYCEGMELMEEISGDSDLLPVCNGKIVGHVERIECSQT